MSSGLRSSREDARRKDLFVLINIKFSSHQVLLSLKIFSDFQFVHH